MGKMSHSKVKNILAIIFILLMNINTVAFAGNNGIINSIIFEVNGSYYEVEIQEWADAYRDKEGDIYDGFEGKAIVGVRSGDRYIDMGDYAEKFRLNPDDPQNALSNAKDLPNEIVNDIKQYPCDDLEVVEVKAITEKLDLEVDDTKVIEYEVEPVKATVTFESNNTGVATVEDDGKVTAKGEGLATITLTGSYGNYEEGTDTVIVNVREREDIELLSYHEYWDGNYWYVVGEIKNNTDKTAKFVRVDLRGYVNDSIKYTDFTYSSPSELAPGETGAFKFMIRESNAQKFDSFLLFLYWSD